MFACLIFGDSLADGIAAAVNARYAQHCEVRAAQGAASTAMLRWSPPPRSYDTTILSIGSNDDIGAASGSGSSLRFKAAARRRRERVLIAITYLRRTLPSHRVIWIMPYERRRAAIVQSIAFSFGDEVLDMNAFSSRDGLHPSDYDQVARRLLR